MPDTLRRSNELGDTGAPNTLSVDAPPRRSTAGLTMIRASGRAPDRPGPSLARLCAIAIVGLAGPPWRSSSSAATDPVGASLPSPAAPVP